MNKKNKLDKEFLQTCIANFESGEIFLHPFEQKTVGVPCSVGSTFKGKSPKRTTNINQNHKLFCSLRNMRQKICRYKSCTLGTNIYTKRETDPNINIEDYLMLPYLVPKNTTTIPSSSKCEPSPVISTPLGLDAIFNKFLLNAPDDHIRYMVAVYFTFISLISFKDGIYPLSTILLLFANSADGINKLLTLPLTKKDIERFNNLSKTIKPFLSFKNVENLISNVPDNPNPLMDILCKFPLYITPSTFVDKNDREYDQYKISGIQKELEAENPRATLMSEIISTLCSKTYHENHFDSEKCLADIINTVITFISQKRSEYYIDNQTQTALIAALKNEFEFYKSLLIYEGQILYRIKNCKRYRLPKKNEIEYKLSYLFKEHSFPWTQKRCSEEIEKAFQANTCYEDLMNCTSSILEKFKIKNLPLSMEDFRNIPSLPKQASEITNSDIGYVLDKLCKSNDITINELFMLHKDYCETYDFNDTITDDDFLTYKHIRNISESQSLNFSNLLYKYLQNKITKFNEILKKYKTSLDDFILYNFHYKEYYDDEDYFDETDISFDADELGTYQTIRDEANNLSLDINMLINDEMIDTLKDEAEYLDATQMNNSSIENHPVLVELLFHYAITRYLHDRKSTNTEQENHINDALLLFHGCIIFKLLMNRTSNLGRHNISFRMHSLLTYRLLKELVHIDCDNFEALRPYLYLSDMENKTYNYDQKKQSQLVINNLTALSHGYFSVACEYFNEKYNIKGIPYIKKDYSNIPRKCKQQCEFCPFLEQNKYLPLSIKQLSPEQFRFVFGIKQSSRRLRDYLDTENNKLQLPISIEEDLLNSANIPSFCIDEIYPNANITTPLSIKEYRVNYTRWNENESEYNTYSYVANNFYQAAPAIKRMFYGEEPQFEWLKTQLKTKLKELGKAEFNALIKNYYETNNDKYATETTTVIKNFTKDILENKHTFCFTAYFDAICSIFNLKYDGELPHKIIVPIAPKECY